MVSFVPSLPATSFFTLPQTVSSAWIHQFLHSPQDGLLLHPISATTLFAHPFPTVSPCLDPIKSPLTQTACLLHPISAATLLLTLSQTCRPAWIPSSPPLTSRQLVCFIHFSTTLFAHHFPRLSAMLGSHSSPPITSRQVVCFFQHLHHHSFAHPPTGFFYMAGWLGVIIGGWCSLNVSHQ